jgi:long-chain acyl-CoA synthetase
MSHTTDFIDPKTAKTIAGLFCERVRRTPHACAYQRFNEEEHRFAGITWEEVFRLAAHWQAALERENLLPGDRVAVALKNCPEWALFDLAALGLGLVTVPLSAGDRPENFVYILEETGSKVLLIDEKEQWLPIEEIGGCISGIQRIVMLHPNAFPGSHSNIYKAEDVSAEFSEKYRGGPNRTNDDIRSWTNSSRDPRLSSLAEWLPEKAGRFLINCRESVELATIVFTSGTTGKPKGVMLSHSNILENAFACLQREPIYPNDLFLSFLPLSHTFERTAGYYLPMMAGACVAYAQSVDKLSEDLLEVQPTILISVPRIYERIHHKIVASLEEKPALVRYLFHRTVNTGWKRFLHLQGREKWKPLLLLWPLLKRIVARRVTAVFGGRLRLSISGGAPLSLLFARVFIGLGLNILQGYGLTETSPVISFNTTDDNIPATVGKPLPGVESAIAADGELLVRGPNIMLGYWRNQDATNAAIDSNGYFHTGDIAQLKESGHLTIVGRIKEILVLSTGEKVPPQDIELAIAANPLFEQVMVVGEGRPYLAALVVLNRLLWQKLAAGHGLDTDQVEFVTGKHVEAILLSEIARLTTRFPAYAQIRRVYASLYAWKTQEGLITTTIKLRRMEILGKFRKEVELLYKGH